MDNIPPIGGTMERAAALSQRRPKGVLVEHRTSIAAPAEIVWELIADLSGWNRWNPLYISGAGTLEIGKTIEIIVALPGTKPMQSSPTVIDVVPNERLEYRAQALGGLLRGTRYVSMERDGEEGCIVSNGEIMGGLLGPMVARRAGERVHLGLQLMNEALRKVAEARWQARSGHSIGMPGRPD